MKYVIDLEPIEGTSLYKAKGFRTLVFDDVGIAMLEPYETETIEVGDTVRTKNGTTLYRYEGVSKDGKLANVVNLTKECYTTVSYDKLVLVSKAENNSADYTSDEMDMPF